ncbi:MAG: DUF92 domain-containing protein [Bacteroidetes bacterium]|nr:DUF92 domain-containing protein [Bacteroidota bacterium]MCW5894054.1 DUF92 domain-containing protein [Bacteroidota bacterium]
MTDQLLIGLLFASVISLFSLFTRFLTPGGAFTQFVLGTILLGLGGWKWTVPMLVFFILSSIISRIGKSKKQSAERYFQKSSQRDAGQVIANGGIAGAVTLIWHLTAIDSLYIAYLGAVAAATADTWATEIGTLSRSSPVLLTTFERVEAGRSGAVSLLGSAAGLAGSAVVLFSGIWWLHGPFPEIAVLIVLGGIFGSTVDSLLGATVQVQYECRNCKKITERSEHCGEASTYFLGFRQLNNDAVNLICTAVGAFSTWLAIEYFA